jgi:glucosamine 6-phosphate synthetase-like amidotransferase/phosphosugar isomerase protein
MCGVIGLRCEHDRGDLGEVACALLRMLEYRGYDSTGAAIQTEAGEITLLKDVGSPTAVTRRLGIARLSGRVFCGQVRWATFGSVTRANAQPHEVCCKTHLYGAHNGNITNCDRLKDWLAKQGHRVVSDNDGEMLVHTVEHYFARELKRGPDRAAALKAAVLAAARKLVGSYAAVVVDPVTQRLAAIKSGSSLYMGLGHDEAKGAFHIASSDLASVLSRTKMLLPMAEGEFALYDHQRADFHDLRTGRSLRKHPVRSRLKVEETELKEPFRYFMQQEIFSQPAAVRKVLGLFLRRSDLLLAADRFAARRPALARRAARRVQDLAALTRAEKLRRDFPRFARGADFAALRRLADKAALPAGPYESALGSFLEELGRLAPGGSETALRLLDGLCLRGEADDVSRRVSAFVRLLRQARRRSGAVYMLACGTSFHAAKVAAVFFNRIAGIKLHALLPGDFRAEAGAALRDGDLIIGISQSGETKDLIDVLGLARAARRGVKVVTLVNNLNSTLALEKTDLCIPLCCGPEIAVPATKSFMNQLAVLYALALAAAGPGAKGLRRRREGLLRVPRLLEQTWEGARQALERAAAELFLAPSIHILATGMQGVAKEGALKIREVALNHTEGYEASEFKHGPNTILGVNTVFGLEAVLGVLARPARPKPELFRGLYANYPLIFVTGPAPRDVNLTVSQINTHKIRGADLYVVAEPDRSLSEAIARNRPARQGRAGRAVFIPLPRTGDDLLPFFTSSLALQLLALSMSVRKLAHLDALGFADHGVHPDSPKNVSKSITVD